jgi:hypothetical protein
MLLVMPSVALDSRSRLGLIISVLVVHALVLMALSRGGVWADRDRAAPSANVQQAPLILQLLPLTGLVASKRSANAPPPKRAAVPRETGVAHPPAATALTAPPTLAAASAAVQTPEAPAAERPASAPPPRLNLALPTFPRAASAPWHQRPAPMDGPRANTPKATLESRLQAAMGGDGRWAEERIDNDHVRYRRGDTCVDFNRSRAEQLDPFQQGSSPKPWLTGPPRPC